MSLFNIFGIKPKDEFYMRQKNYNDFKKQIETYIKTKLYDCNYIDEGDIVLSYDSKWNYLVVDIEKFNIGSISISTQSEINVAMTKFNIGVIFQYHPAVNYDIDIISEILKVEINEKYFKVTSEHPYIKIHHLVKLSDETKDKISFVANRHFSYIPIEYVYNDIKSETPSIIYPDEKSYTFQKSYDKIKSELNVLLDSDIWSEIDHRIYGETHGFDFELNLPFYEFQIHDGKIKGFIGNETVAWIGYDTLNELKIATPLNDLSLIKDFIIKYDDFMKYELKQLSKNNSDKGFESNKQ